jgi:hypothetical protein
LDSLRIDPATKQLLEYNERRTNWEEWYWGGTHRNIFKKKESLIKTWLWTAKIIWRLTWTSPFRFFWWISDYGKSGLRVSGILFLILFFFANLYCHWGTGRNPELLRYLFKDEYNDIPQEVVPWRAIYFSIVTMTTLGLGDIRANPKSIKGHICLAVQVILGYFLIAALVTRLAIMFTAGGPAGEFA